MALACDEMTVNHSQDATTMSCALACGPKASSGPSEMAVNHSQDATTTSCALARGPSEIAVNYS